MYIHIHTYIYIYEHIRTHVTANSLTRANSSETWWFGFRVSGFDMYVYYIYVYIYTHIYTYIYIHTHTTRAKSSGTWWTVVRGAHNLVVWVSTNFSEIWSFGFRGSQFKNHSVERWSGSGGGSYVRLMNL